MWGGGSISGEKKKVTFGYIHPHKEFDEEELRQKMTAGLIAIEQPRKSKLNEL